MYIGPQRVHFVNPKVNESNGVHYAEELLLLTVVETQQAAAEHDDPNNGRDNNVYEISESVIIL